MIHAFVNGNIFTADPERRYVSAMLTDGGTIIWTGEQAELPVRNCPVTDLEGRTVIPGFVDAHMHPVMLAEYSRQIACLPPRVNSLRELKAEIARVHDRVGEDAWICGWGFDEGKFAEHRMPDRHDLDEASPDKPVFLVRSCEHIRCVNSRALAIAGIDRDTPDPPGGEIARDAAGEPTGILKEAARDLVLPFLPRMTEDETTDALAALGELLISQGVVAVADMGNLHPGGNYTLYCKAAEKGFRQRVSLYYMWDYFMDDPSFDIPPERMDYGKRIRIAGLKLIGDGSISGQTAWMSAPYKGTGKTGFPVYSDESLERAIAFAKKYGCQISVHAMGGRAIDRIVERMRRESDWTDGAVPYLRVEHVTEPSPAAMRHAAEKRFAFVSQPIFAYCEIEAYRACLEEERLKRIYPYRTMLRYDVPLSFSTDAPATSWATPSDPFSNIKSAVVRRAYDGTDLGQEERVDIETAVLLYTAEAAKVCGFASLGQLRPGYSADFVVLSENIFAVDPMRIDEVFAQQTWIEGECVYRS